MSDDLRALAREVLDEPCLNGLSASDQLSDEDTMVLEARLASALRAAVAAEREVAKIADFLIEEIIDREGREGMSDYHFTEQVIQLAQDCKDRIAAIRARGDKP